ncbi:MAG: hypothetical protein HC772_20220 [Leptolyngbyaceae cyanobacterium CRU_2_3]|nr:hypothetical protein [Leptolyngbyaceae cyanobacterium CRU_2_3]
MTFVVPFIGAIGRVSPKNFISNQVCVAVSEKIFKSLEQYGDYFQSWLELRREDWH